MKIRIKFAKEGTMKFIGHLDVMRYFQKVMRKAEVDIRYSEGFSPHQIMSFAAPLGVGLTSVGEYVDIEVHTSDSSPEMLRRINGAMVEGTRALSYVLLPDTAGNAMSIVAAADYTICFREGHEPLDWDAFVKDFSAWLLQDQILMMKKTKKGEKEVDIRPMILHCAIDGNEIHMRVATGSAGNLKPEAVIQAYLSSKGEHLEAHGLLIRRDEVYANVGAGEKPELLPLEQLGETIE